jgi:hypothetical protein
VVKLIFLKSFFSLDVDQKVFMDCHRNIALLKVVVVSTQKEVKEVEESNKKEKKA